MEIPLCKPARSCYSVAGGPARNASRSDAGGGTRQIRGGFGFSSLLLFVAFGCASCSARAADVNAHENSLEFQQTEEVSHPVCEESLTRENNETEEDFRFHALLADMLRNEPIETMVPFIAKRDRETAVFLVSIARKESSWGEHAPQKDGVDCYNYWGYKGEGSRGTGMGYACFASPEEAIETVGNRLSELVHEKHLDSPERLIVWKCGSSCTGHSPESVAKWIADVKSVYSRFF